MLGRTSTARGISEVSDSSVHHDAQPQHSSPSQASRPSRTRNETMPSEAAASTVRLWRSDFMSGGVDALKASVAPGPVPVKAAAAIKVLRGSEKVASRPENS